MLHKWPEKVTSYLIIWENKKNHNETIQYLELPSHALTPVRERVKIASAGLASASLNTLFVIS
jgi:hypothetical protein